MENSVSRILIETTVRQTLKGIQEDPERSIRNLVDMALQFSEGRFQSRFFATAHAWLKNDKSTYYNLIPDAVNHIETEHLVRLGMNIGYNSCTWGARHIRANERRLGFNIPWTVFLQMEEGKERCDLGRYHWVIQQGEELGIYSWALFAPENPSSVLPVAKTYSDSAFFLFCPSQAVTPDFTEKLSAVCNVMPVISIDRSARAACAALREAKLPYSVSYCYSSENLDPITSGELFCAVQQLHPLFTVLIPRTDCRPDAQRAAYKAAVETRAQQQFQTIPWELYGDTKSLDAIISDDSCCALFDQNGTLHLPGGQEGGDPQYGNLFHDGLAGVFSKAFPKVAVARS